jgi:hypothetical protein
MMLQLCQLLLMLSLVLPAAVLSHVVCMHECDFDKLAVLHHLPEPLLEEGIGPLYMK